MPIYEYKCDDCATQFELRRKFNEVYDLFCPNCQGKLYRVFLPVPVIFKGSGFHTTDSRGQNAESGK